MTGVDRRTGPSSGEPASPEDIRAFSDKVVERLKAEPYWGDGYYLPIPRVGLDQLPERVRMRFGGYDRCALLVTVHAEPDTGAIQKDLGLQVVLVPQTDPEDPGVNIQPYASERQLPLILYAADIEGEPSLLGDSNTGMYIEDANNLDIADSWAVSWDELTTLQGVIAGAQ